MEDILFSLFLCIELLAALCLFIFLSNKLAQYIKNNLKLQKEAEEKFYTDLKTNINQDALLTEAVRLLDHTSMEIFLKEYKKTFCDLELRHHSHNNVVEDTKIKETYLAQIERYKKCCSAQEFEILNNAAFELKKLLGSPS